MQDKRFLESKVAEMTSTLELVQNQRNELKQSYKVPAPCCQSSAQSLSMAHGRTHAGQEVPRKQLQLSPT